MARFPYVRDAAIFVGNPDDVTEKPFGPGLPGIREWTDRNFSYAGYTLPFDPRDFLDTERLRQKHDYSKDEKIVIASVGGTAVGRPLLEKIAQAFPRMKKQVPELRMILVAGPRLSARSRFRSVAGLEVRPYVHNLFEHLACCDLALVQGGLSTCMELVATRRPFLSFPLAAPLRAERARAPAARELRRRPLRFIRGPHARGARHARARGDARAGALQAGGDGWCGARCETHRSGPGKPMVGAVLVPHR